MTPKELVFKAMLGESVDRIPVGFCWHFLRLCIHGGRYNRAGQTHTKLIWQKGASFFVHQLSWAVLTAVRREFFTREPGRKLNVLRNT